ncbi:hypothetical protein KP803_00245 [Vibrio sp. ZSDE26]|uniref:Uncharacterized protein n=1 Tax=Vibrio amylolyticus TaxID=2847292 RepID=A0A9X2BFD2_9VIBR|nr:hypothetical protein [Vibrio amylolyticus]MCK6261696.1 hypothetical protein [Vibrio amylolyticus]
MQERMMNDKERYLMERMEKDAYLLRRKDLFERQERMFNILPKLLVPMIFLFMVMMLVEPAQKLMTQYERILAAEASGMERLPDLRNQIDVLEKQLVSLSSKSIESRIATIEKSIEVGDIDVTEVATLQKLKADFEVLNSYMFTDPTDLVELKTLQRDYKELKESISSYVHKDVVARELSFLTNLFYTILAFLGILISIVGTSWYTTTKKLKSLNSEVEKET